jgi:hypothetical protein
MMAALKLLLTREGQGVTCTHGRLYVDGLFECFTLEDVDRFLESGGAKVKAQTAIPRGTYKITIDWSNRFQKKMIHILDVPQFEGIRIHAGNTSADTEGCILLGKVRGDQSIHDSRAAVDALFAKVRAALEDCQPVEIEVR